MSGPDAVDGSSLDDTVITVRVGAPAHGGHCIARHEGRAVFVRHALPGELVEARVTSGDPNARFWTADAVNVLEASNDRGLKPAQGESEAANLATSPYLPSASGSSRS